MFDVNFESKHFIRPSSANRNKLSIIPLSRWTGISNLAKSKRDIPEVREPLDQLGGVVLVELDVGEVHLDDGGAGVAHPEEHQLGLPQVHRGQGGVVGIRHGVAA